MIAHLSRHPRFAFGLAVFLALSAACAPHTVRACELPATEVATITGIPDARTLALGDGSQLRLMSILPPSPYDSPAAPLEWPAEQHAIDALGGLLRGRNIAISLERRPLDRWGRRQGHALLLPGARDAKTPDRDRWVQARLVAGGHARVDPSAETDGPCARHLLALEARAETDRRGLWRFAHYLPRRAEDTRALLTLRSTFQIVEGVATRASARRATIYLNFGTDWKRDFTVSISRQVLRRAKIEGSTVDDLLGRLTKAPLRIRGWIEKRNGPLITVWRLEQIERVSVGTAGQFVRASPPQLLTGPTLED